MYPDISTIHKRLKHDFDELTSKGLEVVGVYLQGSQNYGLSYYLDEDHHSDVDTKAIVLPHFEDVVESRNWVSYTHVLEDNSHCDVKDVRLMFDCFKKMNINFLEIVFTDFYYINPDVPFYRILWDDYIVKNKNKIATYHPYRAIQSMYGDLKSKYKNLFHDAPHSHEDIEKYGYCLKDWHHLNRLSDFLVFYIDMVEGKSDKTYKDILTAINRNYLISQKVFGQNVDFIKKKSDSIMNWAKALVDEKTETWKDTVLFERNKEVEELYINVQRGLIAYGLNKDLSNFDLNRYLVWGG